MLIKDKKHFNLGIIMSAGFFGLFLLIMSPVFNGMNGLEYADDIFNKLSKGSAYFVPKVSQSADKFIGKAFSITINFDTSKDPDQIKRMLVLLSKNNITADIQGTKLNISGDLGQFLKVVIRDADFMYHNDGQKLKALYEYDEKKALKDWWTLLTRIDKELQLKSQFDMAKMVNEVNKKLVETSYNYYTIQPQSVMDKLFVMSGLLVFYVVYTMWWGYALYHLFEGVGLTSKKAKVKKEV
ncbi:MAG: hypothetical protein N3A62_06455 [Thermodesulfovibrionales bacterium]|nr:hypothetical protein [Thermodesulfovibrionales bacterium]